MMNPQFYLLFSALMLSSCSESFKSMDIQSFNEKIAPRTDIKTSEELIGVYYNFPELEGTAKLNIESKTLRDNKYKVTLIHTGIEDDSQSAIKIVMLAEKTGQTWVVLKIDKNWKCWDGRGDTSWGTGLCN